MAGILMYIYTTHLQVATSLIHGSRLAVMLILVVLSPRFSNATAAEEGVRGLAQVAREDQ